MLTAPVIVLASTSHHRRELLNRLGLPYECVAPGVDEIGLANEQPWVRSARLALAKASAIAVARPHDIIIGSDQVASLADGAQHLLLHKPGDRRNCHAQLRAMSGKTVRFDTSVAVVRGAKTLTHTDLTLVRFHHLSAAQIESYMDREPSFDCAGGFKCEGLGVTLFEAIETQDPTALVGLPLVWLCEALRQTGVVV